MRFYHNDFSRFRARMKIPGCVIRGEETRCGQNSTPSQGSQEEASKQTDSRPLLTPQYGWGSSRKGRETSETFQVVSFMVFAEIQPTTARGLFTKIIPWHHPQKRCGNHCQSLHGNQTEGTKYSRVKHAPVVSQARFLHRWLLWKK